MIAAAVLCACGAVLAWFAGRARLGARVRGLAGVRLRALDRVAATFGERAGLRAGVGALGAAAFGGPMMMVVATAAGLGWEPMRRARDARIETRRIEEQIPDVLRAIGAAVRAGRSIPQALAVAYDEAPDPVRRALEPAVQRLSVGATIDEALDAFAARARCDAASSAVETIRIARASGANLPAILDVACESLAERDRIVRDRRAATSQARLSAIVIGSMPIAFFALIGSSARAQMQVLFADPIGWVLLFVGLGLETAGFLWVRRLVRA